MPSGKGARERRREARLELQRQYAVENGLPMPEPMPASSPLSCASDAPSNATGNGSSQHYRRANTVDEAVMNAHAAHAQALSKSRSMENLEGPDGGSSPIASSDRRIVNSGGGDTPSSGDSARRGAGDGKWGQAPKRRVAPSWIGNLKSMVRPAQTIASPQGTSPQGDGCQSPLAGEDDEPSGLQDDEISQLENLLNELEVKDRELDVVHLELYQALGTPDIPVQQDSVTQAVSNRHPTAGAAEHGEKQQQPPQQQPPQQQPPQQQPSRGPATTQAGEESGPLGVCESPGGSEGQEERMPSPPRSPDAWQQEAVRRAATMARLLDERPVGFGPLFRPADARGRKARNWKTLFPSRVRKLEKQLQNLEEEDDSLDALHAQLKASVSSAPDTPADTPADPQAPSPAAPLAPQALYPDPSPPPLSAPPAPPPAERAAAEGAGG